MGGCERVVDVGLVGVVSQKTWSCHVVMYRWNATVRLLETRQKVVREILWGG